MTKRSSRGLSGGACFANVVLPAGFLVAITVELWLLITRQSRASPQVACPSEHPCPDLLVPPAAPLAVTAAPVLPSTKPISQKKPPFLSKSRQIAAPAKPASAGAVKKPLPFYDLVALIFACGNEHDVLRMNASAQTWLGWKSPDWTFTYLYVLCHDDPGLNCKAGDAGCARSNPHVVVVPCKHGYSTIVTKSTEGFRYLSHNYRFNYVLKADIDTIVEIGCIQRALKQQAQRCPSFGMGTWRQPGTSKVFTKQDPGAGKYPNEPFKEDSGMSFYPPYMVGWLSVWSADVAHYLGMGGLPVELMPKWKDTWTIDDAAIGTFVLGLDMCRLEVPCYVVTDVEYEQFQLQWDGPVNGKPLNIKRDGPVPGFQGPFPDDVPGIGDIADTWTETLEECAAKCAESPECLSFEHSPSKGKRGAIKNCELATGTTRTGRQVEDYSLYLKEVHYVPDGPIDGYEGPLPDDVPGLGELGNLFTETLEECAQSCSRLPVCKSFEHSPKQRKNAAMKNCQLSAQTQRSGIQVEDFSLYIRKL